MKNRLLYLIALLVFFSCQSKLQMVCPKKYKQDKIHSFRMNKHSFKQPFIYTISDTPDSTFQFIGKKKEYVKLLKKSYQQYVRYNRRAHINQNFHSMILKDFRDTVLYLANLHDTLHIDFREDFFTRRNQHYGVSGWGTSFVADERNFLNKKFRKGKLVLLHNGKPYTSKVLWRREYKDQHSYRWWGEWYYLGKLEYPFYSITKGSVHIRWAH